MELNGALSNPSSTGKDLQIARVLKAKDLALGRVAPPETPMRRLQGHRQGAVLGAVTEVLADGAPRPLRDIQAAVERLLGGSVPAATVRNALSEHSGGEGLRFRRARRGVYERA
jgi:hypothetical protein